MLQSLPAADDDDEFAFEGPGLGLSNEIRRLPAEEFLEFFREFARKNDLAIWHDFREFGEELFDAIGRFVQDQRARDIFETGQLIPALAGFVRQEADEMEFVSWEAAGGQGRDERAGPGH